MRFLFLYVCTISCFLSGWYQDQEACLKKPHFSVEQCKNILGGVSIFVHRGHKGVTQSLIRGLATCGVPYTINSADAKLYDHVFVLAGIDYLHHAIVLKRQGSIKTLLVGPNIMGLPTDYDNILASPEIDGYLVPSDWTAKAARDDVPTLKTYIWYSGIDTWYWSNAIMGAQKNNTILVYKKTESDEFCQMVEQCIEQQGYNPVRMVYGRYTHEQYKQLLRSACAAVFISRSESQGLALAECWAMSVPTLVWDPQKSLVIAGRLYNPVVACPYISQDTGRVWTSFAELASLLRDLNVHDYAPRTWCCKYMSDSESVHRLLDLFVHIEFEISSP